MKTATGKTCGVDGCGKPMRARGLCNNHYMAAWKSGAIADAPRFRAPNRPRGAAISRLSKKSKPIGEMTPEEYARMRQELAEAQAKIRPARGWPVPPEGADASGRDRFASWEPFLVALEGLRREINAKIMAKRRRNAAGRIHEVHPERDEPKHEIALRRMGPKAFDVQRKIREAEHAKVRELQKAV